MDYLSDPDEIYRRSFAILRQEAKLERLPGPLADIAARLIHACGMPDIVEELRGSPDLPEAARGALAAGRPILVDCEMVAAGIIRRRLPGDNQVICTLNHPEAATRGRLLRTTRSAAAVELWAPWLEGALVAIGNAPTALFRLLELLEAGAPRPAALLAFPVGFVGAAESKAALAAAPAGLPFLTLLGRRGGSALAAAAVNALARPVGENP